MSAPAQHIVSIVVQQIVCSHVTANSMIQRCILHAGRALQHRLEKCCKTRTSIRCARASSAPGQTGWRQTPCRTASSSGTSPGPVGASTQKILLLDMKSTWSARARSTMQETARLVHTSMACCWCSPGELAQTGCDLNAASLFSKKSCLQRERDQRQQTRFLCGAQGH